MRRVLVALGVGALLTLFAAAAGAEEPQDWNVAQVGAPAAWAHSTGRGVVVGVVDSGVDATHPDLKGRIDATANCVGGTCRDGEATDWVGHGTAVSGIVVRVAPEARLVVAKGLGDDGAGDIADINSAIRWVVDHGATVVNLSLGDASTRLTNRLGTPLRPAVEYAWTRGAIPVLAAGNYQIGLSGDDSANYGNLDAVVVGAGAKNGALAWYSTPLGTAKWGVVAPGGGDRRPDQAVRSAAPGGGYDYFIGTSLATPHVSGGLALVLATGASTREAVDRLLTTASRVEACGDGCHGRLDLAAALAPVAAPVGSAPVNRTVRETGGRPALWAVVAGVLLAAVVAGLRPALRAHRDVGGGVGHELPDHRA